MSKALSLAVTPSVKLRENQAKLYAFVHEAHKHGKTITLDKVVDQYSQYGCRERLNGKPAYYLYNWKEKRYERKLLLGDDLRQYAVQWFIRNLGTFVIKGLLTAIPTIELSQLEIEAEKEATNDRL